MKKTSLFTALMLAALFAPGQKITTSSATVAFDATTPKDALPKAENKSVIGSIDTQTGDVAFEAAVSNFNFSNPKIQEHFNAPNWMNSAVYPNFTYVGKIENIKKVRFDKDGTYKVKTIGTMTIKGVSKPCEAQGTITVSGGKINVAAKLKIKLQDYGITGQAIDAGKVAKEPKVTVFASF